MLIEKWQKFRYFKMFNKLKENKKGLLILAILLIVSGIAHGYNMFHFPYYENDEGTYMSHAWSLITQGKLAPYTYWYDHAPAGWILIALWAKLTGGFFTFGVSVNSGRVLMLVLHLVTTSLLFYIAKRLSGGFLAGIIAVLIFSLSPLGIYFQRRVLLDNIMIFWVFLSLALLLKEKLKLSHIIVSAISFGIAVLTKENAIFFAPVFVYTVYSKSHLHHRSFAIVKWLAVSGLIVSFYFLYALLKGELFPIGFLDNNNSHVSLLTTLQEQFSRGGNYPFWDKKSDFYINLMEWLSKDKLTIILGSTATLFSIILSIKERSLRIPAFLATLFWVFLIRGRLIIDFYIVPLIPILALNIGMLVAFIIKKTTFEKRIIYYPLTLIVISLIASILLSNPIGQYSRDETTSQQKAIEWLKNNVPENEYVVIDMYVYVDLHESRFVGDKVFTNADWFWKLQEDPQVREEKYQNNWQNINYITLSHEMLKQIRLGTQDFLKKALDNSYLVADWKKDSISYFNLKNYISTNGDWMSIYKMKNKQLIALDSSWRYYKDNFIESYGQVVDPYRNNSTTSEGQSYAMLRAVWLNDKDMFDGLWAWTRDHFQYRTQDKLFSWLWVKDGEKYKLGDSATASDADEDIALSLLFAYKRWGDTSYLSAAKEIINDIWEKEVVRVNGHYYLLSGTGAEQDNGYLINPSYVFPAAYRIFAQVDTKHPWAKLANDSYVLLNKLGTQNNNKTYLPPNWILVDKETGEVRSASKYIEKDADFYGFEAFRTMWRVALDALWFKEPDASEYLRRVEPFFNREWNKNKSFATIYNLEGIRQVQYGTLSTDTGVLSVFTMVNKKLAEETYTRLFEGKFNYDEGFWGDQKNYYNQNWVWFSTALYTNNLPNLWKTN